MFTGLIEEIGTVESVSKTAKGAQITIRSKKVLEGLQTGDSIAVNGTCLTVTAFTSGKFTADCMAETMRRTNLFQLQPGSQVNLERALQVGSRLGGHIVSGHVDGTGKIQDFEKEDNAVWITVEAAPAIMRYVVEKGSIAIDGVSLTVARTGTDHFQVSIIPHTGAATTLLGKQAGQIVNLECDIIGKYVERLMGLPAAAGQSSGQGGSLGSGSSSPDNPSRDTLNRRNGGSLTLEALMENGF